MQKLKPAPFLICNLVTLLQEFCQIGNVSKENFQAVALLIFLLLYLLDCTWLLKQWMTGSFMEINGLFQPFRSHFIHLDAPRTDYNISDTPIHVLVYRSAVRFVWKTIGNFYSCIRKSKKLLFSLTVRCQPAKVVYLTFCILSLVLWLRPADSFFAVSTHFCHVLESNCYVFKDLLCRYFVMNHYQSHST